jgi:transcription initiation factor TFIIB
MAADDEMWTDFDEAMNHVNPQKEDEIQSFNYFMCKCGTEKCYNPGQLPFCTNCGRVDSSYVDHAAEWTNGVSENGVGSDNSRAGDLAVDHGLFSTAWGTGTVIKAAWNSSYSMKRMARINFYQSMNSKDRRLYHSYSAIDKVASQKLELPDDVTRTAKVMYKKFSEGDVLTRGGNRQGIMANCIYYSCKQTNNPRTIDEVSDAYGIDRKFMSRMEEIFLDVVKPVESETCAAASISHRLLNDFPDIQRKDRMKVHMTCEKLSSCSKLMSKQPKTIAATVIMVTLGISRAEVCKRTGVSTSTIAKLEAVVREYII